MGELPPRGNSFDESQLTFHPAPENNGRGIGILVVPGGGYSYVSLDREGTNSTYWLNSKGYDAWVLNYSTSSTAPTPLYPVPMEEALGAVNYIRAQNTVTKLGIWGYSAGGHLAAITVTNPEADLDFGILTYPVITMDSSQTHAGSKLNLLGEDPSPELVELMSAHNAVSSSTPPIFLFHTANDATVPVENTLMFAERLTANSVPYQTLILPDGPHGINLALDNPVLNWTPELDRWLTYSV